jgi:hypothetical protein
MQSSLPSIQFCLTGHLSPEERYNQEIHSYGKTVKKRAPKLLEWYTINQIINWYNQNRIFCEMVLTAIQIDEIHSILYPIPVICGA